MSLIYILKTALFLMIVSRPQMTQNVHKIHSDVFQPFRVGVKAAVHFQSLCVFLSAPPTFQRQACSIYAP